MGFKTYVTKSKDFITNPNGTSARIKDSKGNTVARGHGSSTKEATRNANKDFYKKRG